LHPSPQNSLPESPPEFILFRPLAREQGRFYNSLYRHPVVRSASRTVVDNEVILKGFGWVTKSAVAWSEAAYEIKLQANLRLNH